MSSITKVFSLKELIVIVLFVIITITSPVVMYMQNEKGNNDTLENQGYLRYIACIIDVRNKSNAVAVPVAQLDQCWSIAEEQVGVKLPRYHNLIK